MLAGATASLAPAEVVSNAAVMMFGGIETSEGMTTSLFWHLLSNPDQLAALRADRSLAANAIEESLRLEPAAARVDRYATDDVDAGRRRDPARRPRDRVADGGQPRSRHVRRPGPLRPRAPGRDHRT